MGLLQINSPVKIMKCRDCDPEYFVLYGYCPTCGMKKFKPLYNPKKNITDKEWENYPEHLSELKRDPNTIEI